MTSLAEETADWDSIDASLVFQPWGFLNLVAPEEVAGACAGGHDVKDIFAHLDADIQRQCAEMATTELAAYINFRADHPRQNAKM